jgi:hypothetical protein
MKALLIFLSAAGLWAGNPTIRVEPSMIGVGAFYNGAQVKIEGTAAAGSQVVAVIRGVEVNEVFNRKGRVGPIWVNAEKIHISGVPSFFFAFSPADLSTILRRQAIEEYALDEAAIERRIQSDQIVRASYMSLKTQEGSYQVIKNGIVMGKRDANTVSYAVDFHWPKKAPSGHYEISVYECRDGSVTGVGTASLRVVETGVPAMVSSLAKEHGSLYGAMAILAAVLGGFGIDFLATCIFKRHVSAH